MKIWIFVEGVSDKNALTALWDEWRLKLRENNWDYRLVVLRGKPKYMKKIGHSAAQKLIESENDLVIGLPDLYPTKDFKGEYSHNSLAELQNVQIKLVKQSLNKSPKVRKAQNYMNRFYASALKHDLEMLLLAAHEQLRLKLEINVPKVELPEDQNNDRPPKYIIKDYFHKSKLKNYDEATDAPEILRKATLSEIVLTELGRPRCPAFKEMLDWAGEKTGVIAY